MPLRQERRRAAPARARHGFPSFSFAYRPSPDRKSLMDLGLTDRKAIVCASSRGLGTACAMALARGGGHVVVNGRSAETLDKAAFEISSGAKGSVTPVVADLNTEEGRSRLLAACPDADILVNNNDGPPPGNFAQWGESEWRAALDANMLAPLFM